jgi:glycosyltransferase involved in cell wall biosynthesis
MKISLALPVYNGANYIREALESVILQGKSLDEIVVSDNCSTDETPQIVQEFAARDPRVRLERSEVFLEIADNMSRAIGLCRNEWIQLLCHDDLLRPGAIEALAQILTEIKDTDCALVAHQPGHLFSDGHTYRHINNQGTVETREKLMLSLVESNPAYELSGPDVKLRSALSMGKMPYLPAITTAALRRSAFEKLGGFDRRWVHFDVFFWIYLIRDFSYVEVSSHWTLARVHSQQVAVLSRKNQRSYRDFRDFYQEFLANSSKRYQMSPLAYLKIKLKPISQASAPLVVALYKKNYLFFLKHLISLPFWIWPTVIFLTFVNYFRTGKKNKELWKKVSPLITFE